MFCGGKEKFLFKTKFSLPAFHLLLAFINNAKTESSAVNRYPTIIEKTAK